MRRCGSSQVGQVLAGEDAAGSAWVDEEGAGVVEPARPRLANGWANGFWLCVEQGRWSAGMTGGGKSQWGQIKAGQGELR